MQWQRIHLPMQEMQETWAGSLGQEYPLKKEMAAHSSTRTGKSDGQRDWGGYRPWCHKESELTECEHEHDYEQEMFTMQSNMS